MLSNGIKSRYKRMENVLEYLDSLHGKKPSLQEIAELSGLGEDHFSKEFREFCGLSPHRYLQFLSLEACKERLIESRSLLETSLDLGFSSTSRIHDLFVTLEGMSPGEYAKKGDGLSIEYAYGESRWGDVLMATTSRGICYLGFIEKENGLPSDIKNRWPLAHFNLAPQLWDKWGEAILAHLNLEPKIKIPLHLMGTNFQVQVWKALLSIPPGCHLSYGDLAKGMKKASSTRAVASAVAKNPVSYIIPCHRVIAKNGKIHQYHWGPFLKKAMLARESQKPEDS